MKNLLKIQQKLIPQVIELMERRYAILRQISLSEPIGRRTLSNILDISERVVRSETEFLKEQGLINVAVSGMTITEDGIKLIDELKDVIHDIMGLSTLQERVKNKLERIEITKMKQNSKNRQYVIVYEQEARRAVSE